MPYTSISQTMVREPPVVLDICPTTEFPTLFPRTKEGFESAMNVVFLAIFSLLMWHRACNPARDLLNSECRNKVPNLFMYL